MKMKEFFTSILYSVIIGFFVMYLMTYINGNTSLFSEKFLENKPLYLAIVLAAIAFMVVGAIQYYTTNLYYKVDWKIATVINYIAITLSIVIVFWYLKFIDDGRSFMYAVLSITVFFVINWLYYYKKNKSAV